MKRVSPSLRIIPGMNFLPSMVNFLAFPVTFLADFDFSFLHEKKKKKRSGKRSLGMEKVNRVFD